MRAIREATETNRFGCTARLFFGDRLDRALDLGDFHGLVVDLNHAAEDGTDLGELVLLSRDEIELGQGHDGDGKCGGIKKGWRVHRIRSPRETPLNLPNLHHGLDLPGWVYPRKPRGEKTEGKRGV